MWTDTYFDDDKAADADTMDDRFTEAKSWIDALTGASSRRGAFNPAHAASPLDTDHGVTDYAIYGDDGSHRYTAGVFGTDIVYPGYGTDSGTDSNPLPGTGVGWVVVGHPSQTTGTYGDGPALIEYSTPVDVSTTGSVQAILVLANVEVYDSSDSDPTDPVSLELAFCVQVEYNGSWKTVDTSERAIRMGDLRIDHTSGTERVYFDVPLCTLITRAVLDLKPSYGSGVTGIRVMISFIGGEPTQRVDLRRWNLTALPLRCKVI